MTGAGQTILDKLESFRWTQADLADIIQRPLKSVCAICNNQKEVTAETAVELFDSLGGHPLFWMILEAQRKLEAAGYPEYAWHSALTPALIKLYKEEYSSNA